MHDTQLWESAGSVLLRMLLCKCIRGKAAARVLRQVMLQWNAAVECCNGNVQAAFSAGKAALGAHKWGGLLCCAYASFAAMEV